MKERRQLLTELLYGVRALNPVGSLANLRRVLDSPPFAENLLAKELVAYAHLISFNLRFDEILVARKLFEDLGDTEMLEEIDRLTRFYGFTSGMQRMPGTRVPFSPRHLVPRRFERYCNDHDIVIVRILQEGIDDIRQASWVYLVWDTDGVFKVYKEVLNLNEGFPTRIFDDEGEVYTLLPKNAFYPLCYEAVDIGDGIRFIRMSVQYGRPLSDLVNAGRTLESDQACALVGQMAKALQVLHGKNIAHFDFRPQQVLVDPQNPVLVQLFDLGTARVLPRGNVPVDVYVTSPKFGSPESGVYHKASKASDIFQLGVMFHVLLTGKHPFDLVPLTVDDGDSEFMESALLRYMLPAATLFYDRDLAGEFGDSRLEIVADMLQHDPKARPSANAVIRRLSRSEKTQVSLVGMYPAKERLRSRNTVLFPGRMTIPHKGHVAYIRSLLDLGYFVLISLQRSYTLTKKDPIQKLFTMKMLAMSLQDLGFTPGVDFDFIFTPLFDTQKELRDHFFRLEQMSDVVAIASANPGVGDLFWDFPVIDQEAVFGTEGVSWDDLSWGNFVRRGIRLGNKWLFKKYAATGVEKVRSLRELRSMVAAEPFVPYALKVDVALFDGVREVARRSILPYASPEKSLVFCLDRGGYRVTLLNPYARNARILLDGVRGELVYTQTLYDEEERHETICFEFKSG